MNIPAPQVAPTPGAGAATRLLAGLFRDSPVPIALVDVRSRRIVKANAALERLLDHPPGQLEGRALRELDTGNSDDVESHLLLALACGDHRPQRRSWVTASGKSVPVEVVAARLDGDKGTVLALYIRDAPPDTADDVMAKGVGAGGDGAALRLWMAQKHESLGRLATGFAQELEGILGRVVRSAEALQAGSPSAAAAHAGLGEILGASREARSLVRELLAYTGRQSLAVRTIDINEVVVDAEDALREALTSDIGLLLRPGAVPSRVSADPDGLREVLIHLVEHARDSMPDGGYVVVATEEVELDEAFTRDHPSTRPGRHALLTVSDTGTGMDEEARARIFEPFQGARPDGERGRMGLAPVYGIVKQLGGSIWVSSRPGVGTTFRLYFPKVEETAATP